MKGQYFLEITSLYTVDLYSRITNFDRSVQCHLDATSGQIELINGHDMVL